MVRAASTRGMTLVEMMAGLVVASIVASVVMLSLSIDGRSHARELARWQGEDAAWLALAARARDCTGERRAVWHVARGTLHRDGQPFLDGVHSLVVLSGTCPDVERGVSGRPGVVELRLTLLDGRTFSRAVAVP